MGVILGVIFHFIGGLQEDINRQQANAAGLNLLNVTFHGLRPHSEVPPFLWHADVLLLVPTAHHPSAAWTSPMKLGEYLSSGKPVICSDIPALRNWLNSDEAHFVNPDDPKALVNAIQKILGRPDYGKSLAEKGIKKAKTLTFEKRAMAVLEKLSLT